jgi:hypothetical protein
VLILLGYSKYYEAYIQQKFQLEIPSFTGENCCWISGFSKSGNPIKTKKNPKIRNPPFPPCP